MALPAPRSLNELIGWRISSLRKISAGVSATLSRMSGVRTIASAMRFCAARISPKGIDLSGSMDHTSKTSSRNVNAHNK